MVDKAKRRLAAILAADVAGYTRLVELDTDGTVAAWRSARDNVIKPLVDKKSGHIIKFTGDGFMVEFPSVQDAVACAITLQEELTSSPLNFRMGINVGDITDDGGDVHGEGVNIAARLEALAEPGGICISGDVYNQVRNRIDASFKDMGEQEVKHVSQPVSVYAINPPEQKMSDHITPPTSALPDKPSIAVLAFDNLSGDPGQEYLSDGISESIITALFRLPEILVIPRTSAFSYKGKALTVQQIAEELGVDYVLEGSVQRSDNRIRVTAQLVDAADGVHIWAQQYDRQWEDIFALQDDITQHIVANITSFEGPLEKAIRARVKQKAPTDLRAYDYLLLGCEHFMLVTEEDNARAQELFQKAVEVDPSYSRGHAWLAWTYHVDITFGWSDESLLLADKALRRAQKAVELDNTEADAHWVLGSVLAIFGEQPEVALAEYERALSLNPNNADLLAEYGWSLPRLGRAGDGVDTIKKAIRINPVHPDWYAEALMHALHVAKRYHEVIAVANTMRIRTPSNYLDLAGSYAQLDQLDAAQKTAAKILDLKPEFSIGLWRERMKFVDPADLDHYLDGLYKAGLPE